MSKRPDAANLVSQRWRTWAGGYVSPTEAQLAALEDFRDLGRDVILTKDMARAIESKHGLTRDELGQVMDEWLGFHKARTHPQASRIEGEVHPGG